MTDFNYKKYSLEKLEEWVHDALSCEATPQEIYNTIKEVVVESRQYHKHHASRAYELMCLLNGNGKGHVKEFDDCVDKILSCDKDDPSPECKKSWVDFWEETYYPEESKQYTEEELNAMCDKAASDVEKEKCREYNLREAEYYNKRAQLDAEYTKAKIEANSPYNDGWTKEHYQKMVDEIEAAGGYEWTPQVESPKSKHYYEYDRNDPNRENPFKDRVTKWVLPVRQVKNWVLPPGTEPGSDVDYNLEEEYVVNFPDDLLEAANLKEGDQVEWVDQGDGSYLLRKV